MYFYEVLISANMLYKKKILAPVMNNFRIGCFINSLLRLNSVSPATISHVCISVTMGDKFIDSGI